MRGGHDQWGKTESLFKRNFSLLKNDSDWFVLVPFNSLHSSKYILYENTPAFASVPFKCNQTQRRIGGKARKS